MADLDINSSDGKSNLELDICEITPEEDLFADDTNIDLETIEISNSDMYISIFPDENDKDSWYKEGSKTFLKINTTQKNLNYSREEQNEVACHSFSSRQTIENSDGYLSVFSDDEVENLLEDNNVVFEPSFYEELQKEAKRSPEKAVSRTEEKQVVGHRKKRIKLFSPKSWMSSEEYLRINVCHD